MTQMEMESSKISNRNDASSVQEIDAETQQTDTEIQEMDAETKATLETELKSWTASSAEKPKEAGTEREYKFPTPPDWKCSICGESIESRAVYQCQIGHLACDKCCYSGRNCLQCSKPVKRIRNLAVEDIMNSLVVTCKFANLGCKQVIQYKHLKMSDHEEHCSFAPMVCPVPSCSQVGVKNLLAQHLLSKHKISCLVGVEHGSSKEFELDSSTTSVMVRHVSPNEFHLLRQESTTLGDKLQITSLAESCKRKFQLDVTISEEQTYCLKSVSTSNMQQGGQLVIPKQRGDNSLKKRCKIFMY